MTGITTLKTQIWLACESATLLFRWHRIGTKRWFFVCCWFTHWYTLIQFLLKPSTAIQRASNLSLFPSTSELVFNLVTCVRARYIYERSLADECEHVMYVFNVRPRAVYMDWPGWARVQSRQWRHSQLLSCVRDELKWMAKERSVWRLRPLQWRVKRSRRKYRVHHFRLNRTQLILIGGQMKCQLNGVKVSHKTPNQFGCCTYE